MKKLILLFCACTLLSCKKNSDRINNEDITNVKWVLETAVLDRPLQVNGGATTDYIAVSGPQTCIGSNYTMSFLLDSIVYLQSQIA
jgi:hypothetical protein